MGGGGVLNRGEGEENFAKVCNFLALQISNFLSKIGFK
jgi:hypothetical protein